MENIIMKRSQADATVSGDMAAAFATCHEEGATDEINVSKLGTLLNLLVSDRIRDIRNLNPTENPNRPLSVLVGDCTLVQERESEELTFEVMCTEQCIYPEGRAPRKNGDPISPVSEEIESIETEHQYDTVTLNLYEKDQEQIRTA